MTPLTDAQLVRVYGKTGEMCAATPTCGHPTYVPAEFARGLEEEAVKGRQVLRAYRVLKLAVEAMIAPLGYHGTISARDDLVQAVMDALAQVDEVEKSRSIDVVRLSGDEYDRLMDEKEILQPLERRG